MNAWCGAWIDTQLGFLGSAPDGSGDDDVVAQALLLHALVPPSMLPPRSPSLSLKCPSWSCCISPSWVTSRCSSPRCSCWRFARGRNVCESRCRCRYFPGRFVAPDLLSCDTIARPHVVECASAVHSFHCTSRSSLEATFLPGLRRHSPPSV